MCDVPKDKSTITSATFKTMNLNMKEHLFCVLENMTTEWQKYWVRNEKALNSMLTYFSTSLPNILAINT